VKIKLYDYPEKEFGILGVNNKIGLFDAYKESGCNINQPYKKVCIDDLAYNPYRINVGSIGWKTELHKHDFISPAYVVFSCNEKLSAEFLYKVFKTDTFNKIINDNTTGSVRQNLKFNTLSNIKIPLPPLEEQNRIVKTYNKKIRLAEQQELEASQIEQDIESYLFDILVIKKLEEKENKKGLRFVQFNHVERWAVDFLNKVALISKVLNGKYETIKLKEFIISYQYGLSEKASKEKIGTPMLRMNNIFNSEIVVDNLKYINIDGSIKNKYRLNKGDLLFNRTNSKELVGKTAIFNKDGEYTFASYLIRVVIDSTKANLNYINFLFNSTLLKYQKDMISRQITGQANINAQEMQDFLFPLPPLKIQTEIANTIEKMKAKMKTLQQQAEENRKLAIEEFEKEIFQ
jgi:restriction endonuclease S subunit